MTLPLPVHSAEGTPETIPSPNPTKSTTCACSFQIISAHTTPPPQYFIPVPVKATPIKVTVMAVTKGGKIF